MPVYIIQKSIFSIGEITLFYFLNNKQINSPVNYKGKKNDLKNAD